jgi:hypothetical protein
MYAESSLQIDGVLGQAIATPSDENQIVMVAGKQARQFVTDASGRASDQDSGGFGFRIVCGQHYQSPEEILTGKVDLVIFGPACARIAKPSTAGDTELHRVTPSWLGLYSNSENPL